MPLVVVLELNNYYYVLVVYMNIISISCLNQEGFTFTFKNKSCSFFHDNMFYDNGKLINGLYKTRNVNYQNQGLINHLICLIFGIVDLVI